MKQKDTEKIIRDKGVTGKRKNIREIGVAEEEELKDSTQATCEEIMTKNF